jgi:hypothetical protein
MTIKASTSGSVGAKAGLSLANDPSQDTRLRTERLASGKRELLAELRRQSCGASVVVPKGFRTDFSSIPFWARFVVRWSRVDVAGVVHDWCYHLGLRDESGKPSRALSDKVWRDIAQRGDSKANALQAWVCWTGLRLGGWIAWNRHRAEGA